MRALFLILLVLTGADLANAQKINIDGIVKDNSDKPVVDASVSLLKAADSSWLQSTLTDDKGGFRFTNIAKDAFLLNVDAAGYERAVIPVTKYTDVAITVTQKLHELAAVEVKSNAPKIRSELGKLIVNFEETSVSGGDNVLDLLRRAPGVTVDGNGNISMNGKGVLVTINGKQSYLSGDDLISYLKGLSAEQIAQLELMNQPSAKYDAEGNAGIINIKTKKIKKPGFNGNAEASYKQGVYPTMNGRANLNFKQNSLTLFANAAYLHATGFLNQDQLRTTTDSNNVQTTQVVQNSFLKETFEDYKLTTGFEYEFSPKTNVSGSLTGVYHPNTEKDITNGTIHDLVSNETIYNTSGLNSGLLRKYMEGNLYADYKPGKDHDLSMEINGFFWYQKTHKQLTSQNVDEYGQLLPDGLLFNSAAPQHINVLAGRADYSGSLGNKIKFEAGLKSSYLMNNTNPVFYVYENSQWQYDTTRSNNYKYSENINAAYVSAGKEYKKWQVKLGLRAEQTNIRGIQTVHDQQFDKSFLSLFPTVFVSYKLNEQNTFELDYGRRVTRPSYRDLNPFLSYLSQYSVSSGNPDLLPQYKNSITLRHNYKNMLFSEVSCGRVSDMINPVIDYDEASKIVLKTLHNYAQKYNVHAGVSLNKELRPWWTLTSSCDFYFNEYRDSSRFLASSTGQSFSISNEFKLKGWSFFAHYNYNSGDLQSLVERNGNSQWMATSIAKKMWKDTATVKISFEDPFALYRYTPHSSWNGVTTDSRMQYQTQSVTLAFTYNFGEELNIKHRESKSEIEKRL
jgi:hypothetical protein